VKNLSHQVQSLDNELMGKVLSQLKKLKLLGVDCLGGGGGEEGTSSTMRFLATTILC